MLVETTSGLAAEQNENSGQTPLIYVVDDDEGARNSLKWLIESAGYQVHAFATATDCLKAHGVAWPICMIVYLRMPGMGGMELVEALHAKGVFTRTILISAYADVQSTVRAMKLGIVDVMEKPPNDHTLLECIKECFASDDRNNRRLVRKAVVNSRLNRLTHRERQVMELIVDGCSNKEAARRLQVSPKTIEKHRAKVMLKMGAKRVQDLVKIVHQAE